MSQPSQVTQHVGTLELAIDVGSSDELGLRENLQLLDDGQGELDGRIAWPIAAICGQLPLSQPQVLPSVDSVHQLPVPPLA